MPRNIKQEVIINAEPNAVYDALLDTRKHTTFTGAKAKVSKKVGGVVSCYDGYIKAVNVELEPGKRIVQAQRDTDWDEGTWSIVTYKLKKARGKKTALSFTHYGVPNKSFSMINKGWREYYWSKLNSYFAEQK